MRKANSSFSILILFIFIVLQNNPANGQWFGSILSTNISPDIISINDTITIEIFCEFPSGSCQIDELTIGQYGNTFEVNAAHCLGMLYYICGAVDVIEIPPQAPGDYQLDFQLFSGSSINGECYFYNFADFISIPFTVLPVPVLQCPEDFSVCLNDSPIILGGAVPSGGIYYGPGVSAGSFFPGLAGPGNHEITYQYTDPLTGISDSCTFNITVFEEQVISIPQGWSGLSSYRIPYDPNVTAIFNFSSFIILQNMSGYYWSSVNTLENWDTYSGYAINVSADHDLTICGNTVTNKTVYLNANWNLIPVLSEYNVDVADLFSGVDEFIIAKDVAGSGVYWPDQLVNTLGNLQSGKAYYVKMTSPGSIDYSASSDNTNPLKSFELANTTPWKYVHHSPGTHIVAISPGTDETIETGDYMAAFTQEGLCAGMTLLSDAGSALVINGDDIYTDEKDGFVQDELIRYKLYRPSTREEFDTQVEYDPSFDNTGRFHNNGLSAVTGINLISLGVFGEVESTGINIFPNPSPGIFNIEGVDGNVHLTIFKAFGVVIMDEKVILPDMLDLSSQPKGIYIIRIVSDKGFYYKKLILE